jgi:tetratricopeptide (TPR) repeat protein
LLALIELDNAKVADHERQFQCQQKFYDYLMIAYSLDKFNPVVLNLLANYTFDTWKTLQGLRSTQLTEATKIISSDTKLTSLVEVGSVMRIERKEYSVTNVSEAANSTTILLSHPIQNVDLPVEIVDLDIIDYKGARDFAQRSARHATVSLVRAESYYILGKISQAQKRFKLAYDFYKRSYYESTEMILAYFGEAQVVFALGDYATALELFEKIKTNSNVPDDRDTLAYIGLLRGVVRGELMELDALKEVAPGFAFEFELWLSQGQLRLKKQIDHPVGLKCLLSAESILRKKLMAVPFDLLLNISTLYQYQGKYKESKQYACFAMNTYDGPHVEMPRELLLHNDLESFYFQWSDTVGTAVQSSSDPHCFRIQLPVTHQHFLQVGTHIRINGVVWTIRSMVSKEEISADTLFGGALLMLNEPLNFQVKLPRNNFCDTTILCSYNFARALEEDWKLQAASAIYKLLIQLHPSFMDGEASSVIFRHS